MKLTPPKQSTFWASVVIGVLGIVGGIVPSLPLISQLSFELLIVAFVLLVLGNLLPGL